MGGQDNWVRVTLIDIVFWEKVPQFKNLTIPSQGSSKVFCDFPLEIIENSEHFEKKRTPDSSL